VQGLEIKPLDKVILGKEKDLKGEGKQGSLSKGKDDMNETK